jgi:two-component system CheB/CheR fusion protein
VLNLIPADLNRSIAHINPNIDCPNLSELIIESMDSVTAIERDVRDRQGRWFALRIRPYKSLENRIDGAVVALFDIDILKRSEQSAQRAQSFADGLMQGAAIPIALLERDLRIHKVNAAFAALLGKQAAELSGRALADAGSASWNLGRWRDRMNELSPGDSLPALTVPRSVGSSGATVTLSARAVPAPDSPETVLIVVTASTNGETS